MTPQAKLNQIYAALQARGEPGTAYRVAKILQVAPSTVSRWERGLVSPQGRTAEALDLLYRTAVHAERGNEDANQIFATILTGAGAGLLGLGVGGILIAAGLAWILSGEEERKS